MRSKIRRPAITAGVLSAVLVLAGTAPSGAHELTWEPTQAIFAAPWAGPFNTGTGHVVAQARLSPHLAGKTDVTDDGFPCGNAEAAAMDAVNRSDDPWEPWDAGYGDCYGDLYSGEAKVAGSGVDQTANNTPFFIAGDATVEARYTYSEPCQYSEVLQESESETGEAIGWLKTETAPGANVVYGSNMNAGPAVTYTKFWWSRVGLNAIIVLKDSVTTFGMGTPGTTTDDVRVRDANAQGSAVALFIPDALPDCNAPAHPSNAGGGNGITIYAVAAY